MPYYSSSTLLISNCLFDANVASSDGGAVALNDAYQSGIA
jgi:predicted outer membrane repeat protein